METLITLTGRPPGGVIATTIRSRSRERAIQGQGQRQHPESVEDWTAFAPLKPPEAAPDVDYIVLDDVGLSAMCSYGPIETPNIDKIAGDGVRYTQWQTEDEHN